MRIPRKSILVGIDVDLLARIDSLAEDSRLSRSWVVSEVLRGWFDQHLPIAESPAVSVNPFERPARKKLLDRARLP